MTDEERDARLQKLHTASSGLTIIPYTLFIVLIGAAVYASIYYNNRATAYAAEAQTLPAVKNDVSTLKEQVGTIDQKIKTAPPSNIAIAELSRKVEALSAATEDLRKKVEATSTGANSGDLGPRIQALEQQLAALQAQQTGTNNTVQEIRKMFDEYNRQYQANEARQNEIIQALARRFNNPSGGPTSPLRSPSRSTVRPPG